MKKLLIPVLVATLLHGCGDAGGEVKPTLADTSSVGDTSKPAARLASTFKDHHTKPTSYESVSVNSFPAECLDRPFTYLMNRVISHDDQRHYLYTVIPHAADVTYKLVNEKLNGTLWELYFQAFDSQGMERGLFVHTIYQLPKTVSGSDITDIMVNIMDKTGTVLVDVAGADTKARRPRYLRMGDKNDVDPNYPPEDVTIYLNGGKDTGVQYISGFAYVMEMAETITLTDNTGANSVEFALDPLTGTPTEFIYFEHDVDPFTTNPVKATFLNTDADATTEPRFTICVP